MKNMINVMKERIPSSMQYDGKIDQMKIKQIAIIPVETHCTLYIHACKVDGEKFVVQFIHAMKSGNKMTDGTLTMQRVKAQEINVIVNDEMYDAMKISNALDHAFNIQLSWKIFTASFAKSLF